MTGICTYAVCNSNQLFVEPFFLQEESGIGDREVISAMNVVVFCCCTCSNAHANMQLMYSLRLATASLSKSCTSTDHWAAICAVR